MKFIPILFSTEMVNAIRDNRKTMTRRTKGLEKVNANPDEIEIRPMVRCFENENDWGKFYYEDLEGETIVMNCPYGNIGDVLWVREGFIKNSKYDTTLYSADYTNPEVFKDTKFWKKKPSIHMPKSACRLFLEITNIRVERLQDISHGNAIKEGVRFDLQFQQYWCYQCHPGKGHSLNDELCENGYYEFPKQSFGSLWKTINGEKSWAANPWVWVVEFKRIDKPQLFNPQP